ncbi:MAG: hypothetical protein LQ338_002226 [Usnochroma carphineum]|nr:MAG: hypothetical protein LQ338_002226 [Usnochroma carphineum]
MPQERDDSKAPKNPRLVQSKLTNDFGAIKISSRDPLDSLDDIVQGRDQATQSTRSGNAKLDLHPSRRANLKARPPALPSSKRSVILAAVAEETKCLLPGLLKVTPDAPATGELIKPDTIYPAFKSDCPNLGKTLVRVLNIDTLDAAIRLAALTTATVAQSSAPPVLVLNMANAKHGGGGWLKGALAQEEAICYRSSLSFSLKRRFYPLPDRAAIYSPTVVVIRESLAKGHRLMDLSHPEKLPVVSVVSVAAIRDPSVQRRLGDGDEIYSNGDDRDLMRAKLRMILRIAAAKGHRRLVLGALGCGAFGNPKGEVVRLWKELLTEPEFSGGWWEDVVFAVLDDGGGKESNGNYGVFWRGLNGLEV